MAKKELLQLLSLSSASSEFDIQRNLLDKERLRTEFLQQKVNLASAEIRLQNLENEYERAKGLIKQQLLSESQFDLAEKISSAVRLKSMSASFSSRIRPQPSRRLRD